MTATPTAHHVCQCCGRSGTREFVTVGTECWECASDTAGYRETIDVECQPDEQLPFRVWVRGGGPDHALTSQSEGRAFDTSAEAAKQVSTIRAAIARRQEELENL